MFIQSLQKQAVLGVKAHIQLLFCLSKVMTQGWLKTALKIWVNQETQCIMQCKTEGEAEREKRKENAMEHNRGLQDQQGLATAPCCF